jgi:hypothetical protein
VFRVSNCGCTDHPLAYSFHCCRQSVTYSDDTKTTFLLYLSLLFYCTIPDSSMHSLHVYSHILCIHIGVESRGVAPQTWSHPSSPKLGISTITLIEACTLADHYHPCFSLVYLLCVATTFGITYAGGYVLCHQGPSHRIHLTQTVSIP